MYGVAYGVGRVKVEAVRKVVKKVVGKRRWGKFQVSYILYCERLFVNKNVFLWFVKFRKVFFVVNLFPPPKKKNKKGILSMSCGVSFGIEFWLMMHPFFGKSFPLDTPIFWQKIAPWCTPFDCTLARKADPKWSPQQQEEEKHFPCFELSAIAAAKKKDFRGPPPLLSPPPLSTRGGSKRESMRRQGSRINFWLGIWERESGYDRSSSGGGYNGFFPHSRQSQ